MVLLGQYVVTGNNFGRCGDTSEQTLWRKRQSLSSATSHTHTLLNYLRSNVMSIKVVPLGVQTTTMSNTSFLDAFGILVVLNIVGILLKVFRLLT